jgi:hypothetical protein
MDSVEDPGSPVVMLLQVGTLGLRQVEVTYLGGDVMGQGYALYCEGDQASWEEWDQGRRARETL